MSNLRDDIIRQVDRAHSFEGDEHTFVGSDDVADAILALVYDAMTSRNTLQAAVNAIGRLDRTGGPDPNGYVAYRPRDYAEETITSALEAAGIVKGENDEPSE